MDNFPLGCPLLCPHAATCLMWISSHFILLFGSPNVDFVYFHFISLKGVILHQLQVKVPPAPMGHKAALFPLPVALGHTSVKAV